MCETTDMVMAGLRGEPIEPTPWIPTNEEILSLDRKYEFMMGKFPFSARRKMFLWTRINGVQTFKWIDDGTLVSIPCP